MALSSSDLISCSFDQWYPKFQKVTLESEIIPLTEDVLKYLLDNGTLVIPGNSDINESNSSDLNVLKEFSDSEDEDICNDTECPVATIPTLSEFTKSIRAAISKLGGQVFPKLNWSSPKDACWMATTNSLKCFSPSDVYLLLKSSDIVEKDIAAPFKECEDNSTNKIFNSCLVLRRWRDINPSTEFRCFVVNKKFVGFCPRDVSQHYPCLGVERSSIMSDLKTFYKETIENRFPLNNYVFDVLRKGKDKVLLLDFSPLHKSRTQPLLFSWEDLLNIMSLPPPVSLRINEEDSQLELEICENMQNLHLHNENDADSNRIVEEEGLNPRSSNDPEFRYINEETGVQPHFTGHIGVPDDLKNFGSIPNSQELFDLLRAQNRTDSSEEETEDL